MVREAPWSQGVGNKPSGPFSDGKNKGKSTIQVKWRFSEGNTSIPHFSKRVAHFSRRSPRKEYCIQYKEIQCI